MTENTVPNMRLELVPIPVSDVERAIDFYVNKVGFHLDHDVRPSEANRVVQLTPPGSGCSILLSVGLPEISEMVPGSVKALHLVVDDIQEARESLLGRGVECGGVDDMGGILYFYFKDPDGYSCLLQEIPASFGEA
jgi:catechol 2,3-dioxygenase-like lactoylglutathione lyase family enzyme